MDTRTIRLLILSEVDTVITPITSISPAESFNVPTRARVDSEHAVSTLCERIVMRCKVTVAVCRRWRAIKDEVLHGLLGVLR